MVAGGNAVRGFLVVRLVAITFASSLLFGGLAFSVQARPVSVKVQNACMSDYNRFCSSYKVGSTKLRQCMRSHGRRLSNRCLRALVDAGQISRKVLRRRRRASRR